jgi:hypothetical protein
MIIDINKQSYNVKSNEFNKIIHNEYNNLTIRDSVGSQERIISLLNELSKSLNIDNGIFINPSHGAFVPINCSNVFKQVYIVNTLNDDENIANIEENILLHKLTNILLVGSEFWTTFYNKNNNENQNKQYNQKYIIYTENANNIDTDFIKQYSPIILSTLSLSLLELKCTDTSTDTYIYRNIYDLTNSNLYLYIPNELHSSFINTFHYFIKPDNVFDYDNLINLCIMVKNGGPQFEQMLIDNLPIIDKWTILDTGSTDNTINIINKVLVGKKNGNLYQEPFINFRESRNRLLDLAGTSCKYNIMLDDTYVVQGDLRSFLTEVRGDQYANSFTLYIKSDDTQYGSNRIIKSNSRLRYIHKIHEVITDKDNINVVIPESKVMIDDRRFDYMEKRTHERKQLDLKLLYEEVEENPNDPRAYYYLAQTYNLLEDYEKAFYYFIKRCEFINSGFLQERVDAAFEAARLANFKLNKPWSECEELYNKAFKIDESRPETQYFIGIHYYLENNLLLAYKYFKKSFEIGFPLHCQYSLKPTLSFHFLPKFLARTCYQPCIEDFKLGEEASIFFLQNNKSTDNDYEEMVSWYKIFNKLNSFNPNTDKIVTIKSDKPFFVYIADGGFNQWTGSTILEKGVGGSETYIIEMARYIQQSNKFQTVVFCNTPNNLEEFFEDVIYKPLTEYASFIKNNKVHTCFISRFSEYLPLTYKSLIKNIYLVLHDLTASGNVIPIEPSLKRIFCLSEWHAEYYSNIMPALKHLITPFYYGIDINKFINNNIEKIPYKFIYSSFPNRGLLPLLQMWKHIVEIQPLSQLHIYSDINGKWVNEVAPEQIKEIKILLDFYNYNNNKSNKYNIFLHGWVSKDKLAEAWQSSDIWFYPCTFMETFCLTALEAAITKTLVVTNDLAALQNTVGNRGIIINGDPMTKEWQENTISILTPFLQNNIANNKLKEQLINTNYNWAKNLTWKNQATKMLDEYIYPTLISNNNLDFEKNLIYICIFGKEEYIQLTNLLLHSLYLYGNVNSLTTDLLVYTNSNFKNIIKKNICWIKYFNINFIINDSINTKLDACKSRFDIFNFDLVNKYNNIFYLDTDIIINNDINLIFELCKEDKLYASYEAGFKIDDPIHGNNWGKRLFSQDELNNIEDKNGFNSGVLLFKNGPNVRKIFNNILKDTRNLIETEIYDQEFLNYHFITASLVDKYLLEVYTKNICNNPVGDLNYNKTILHFYVQGFDEKVRMMNAFLNNKKEQFINQTIIKVKEIIINKLVPIIAEIGESLEGCFFSDHLSNTITNHRINNAIGVCDILINKSVTNVLEIGFNAGFSSLLMLLINPHINLTCIDICEHHYTIPCYEYIKSIFPNRITLIKGSSEFVLPELIKQNNKYDMIHIDGGHSNRIFFHDTQNSIKLINKDGILLVDDYDFHYIKVIWDLFVEYYGFKKYREIETQSAYIV